jgi:hypothetical protein
MILNVKPSGAPKEYTFLRKDGTECGTFSFVGAALGGGSSTNCMDNGTYAPSSNSNTEGEVQGGENYVEPKSGSVISVNFESGAALYCLKAGLIDGRCTTSGGLILNVKPTGAPKEYIFLRKDGTECGTFSFVGAALGGGSSTNCMDNGTYAPSSNSNTDGEVQGGKTYVDPKSGAVISVNFESGAALYCPKAGLIGGRCTTSGALILNVKTTGAPKEYSFIRKNGTECGTFSFVGAGLGGGSSTGCMESGTYLPRD